MRVRAAALGLSIAVALLSVPACEVEGQAQHSEDELRLELQLRDAAGHATHQVPAGGSVAFVLTLYNPTDEARRLAFSSAKTHDITVSRADGEEVWRMTRGLVFAQMITEIVLPPGGSRELPATWHAPPGTKPGEYRAQGTVTAQPTPLEATAVAFRIE